MSVALQPNATQAITRTTRTFERPHGPLVVDVWDAQTETAAAPILLVHGWGGTGSYWEKTARALSKTAQVIVPDLPGTGRSQPIRRTHNLFDQVAVLAEMLDLLGLERVQIVAHSMGSAMSVLLAAQHPNRVERLVLTSLTFFMTKQQEQIYENVMRMFRVSMYFRPNWLVDVPGMTRMMGQQYFHRLPPDKAVLRQGLQDYLDLDRATALACADNATDERIKAAGYDVQCPTLLVVCRQDLMMPLENVDFTAEIIPNCDVRWIEDCGHLPMVEKPTEYLGILREFLDL